MDPQKPPQPPKRADVFRRLKDRAYVRAFMDTEKGDLSDFVSFAKNYLCLKTNTLYKAPIWETYTNEEILVEYFTHLFTTVPQFKTEYESATGIVDEDLHAWFDTQIANNKVEIEKKIADLPETVVFEPGV